MPLGWSRSEAASYCYCVRCHAGTLWRDPHPAGCSHGVRAAACHSTLAGLNTNLHNQRFLLRRVPAKEQAA